MMRKCPTAESCATESDMSQTTANPLKRTLLDLRIANSLPSALRCDALTPLTESPTALFSALKLSSPPRLFNVLQLQSSKSIIAGRKPRTVSKAHFSIVVPEPSVSNFLENENAPTSESEVTMARSYLIGISEQCGVEELELDVIELLNSNNVELEHESNRFVNVVSGNELIPGSDPWAYNYGGYQFGFWAGQLGDGRAITLIHTETSKGGIELALKGAGMTPYSRFADGYAVLRSSIREFLACEALYALGVPTSRALSLVAIPGRKIHREVLEGSGVVARVVGTAGWLRFGSFELWMKRGDGVMLKELTDVAVKNGFPEIWQRGAVDTTDGEVFNKYAEWFGEVVDRTAVMIAHWQSVGFCHGVMNTDNFSILGVTIDFGPYQFMDNYDPTYICNHSDEEGRYSFNKQPSIAYWNLNMLGSAISSLVVKYDCEGDVEAATKLIHEKLEIFQSKLSSKYQELITL
ncbi:hypothetical protein HK096_003530, partial [Nowakowskiella sp. JEL0078]